MLPSIGSKMHPQSIINYCLSLCIKVSQLLGASLELGCFLAGVAISTLGSSTVDQVSGI